MDRAIELARRGIGRVSPNPLVGCVLSIDHTVIGEGAHEQYGQAHAEVNAVQDAERKGIAIEGATAYVTLEPCAHTGKTGPCADLLIAKKIARCVIAVEDPYHEVAGKGIERMRQAGIVVETGLQADQAREMNRYFLKHVTTGLPYVVLKIAQSLDGRTALASGESRWVTSELSRARVHQLRAELDAVLIGSGTALADDPALTVRDYDGRNPIRVVLDTHLKLPASLRVFSHEARSMLVTYAANVGERTKPFDDRNVEVIGAPLNSSLLDLDKVLRMLSDKGIGSVLVEAGPRLAAGLLRERLVDELMVFTAPTLMGAESRPAIGVLGVDRMDQVLRWQHHSTEVFADGDVLSTYRIIHP